MASRVEFEFSNQQSFLRVDADLYTTAAEKILQDHGVRSGTISIAVVDDPTIRAVNRRHLEHDYATDALSFLFERRDEYLEGEILVSAETAVRVAQQYGWAAENELLLYVIHAALHLVGYDDQQPPEEKRMRAQERHYLDAFGVGDALQSTSQRAAPAQQRAEPEDVHRSPGDALP